MGVRTHLNLPFPYALLTDIADTKPKDKNGVHSPKQGIFHS